MKGCLYFQYLVMRPLGVSPEVKAFDTKADFILSQVTDNEQFANTLARRECCYNHLGYMTAFVVRVPYSEAGSSWFPPQNLSIRGDRVYRGGTVHGDWIDEELSTNINNVYFMED